MKSGINDDQNWYLARYSLEMADDDGESWDY